MSRTQPFAWCSDPETRRTVFVEIEGELFGYKFVGYDSQEMPAVEYRFKVNGILKAEGFEGRPKDHVAMLVGFALVRRRYRQDHMTQRHCRTCCC